MRMKAFAVAVVLLSAAPALANDSTAELATGGLVFTKSDAIEMRSEDLFISTREIRVVYRFVNRSPNDVVTLVAFPMPEIKVEHMDQTVSVPVEDARNPLGFRTTANGKPVTTRVEQKVMAGGADHTRRLEALNIPLAPHLQSTNEALDRLPEAARAELVRLGLAEIEEYDAGKGMQKHLGARWALRTTHYWEQSFPAGAETVIEHRYRPSVGGTVQTSLGEPGAASEDWFADYRRKYCMEADFLRAIERARRAAKTEFGSPFMEERIEYVLTTGANWAGPIGEFRLVVDKGEPKNLVSFCGEGVKKIAPTRFEMRQSNFTPKENLYVLILKPLSAQR